MASDNLDIFFSNEVPGMMPTFTVSGFVSVLNQTLELAYPVVEIEGEVSSFNVNQGKFIFFDLKDEEASVNCFMMAFSLRTPLEDGMKVKITASPKLTNKGRFSLTVKNIQLSGEGTLKRAYELLKAKLEKEGLFDETRKRPLPSFPKKVVVVTSEDSAGYADFKKIVQSQWGGVEYRVAHVQVQGQVAADQIVRALNFVNELPDLPDVIVVIRGGGSLEDLATFNDELVTRAIASSRVPTLVGIGHEVDVTLAELAADVRASTPSNAAQILVPNKQELISAIEVSRSSINSAVSRIIDGRRTLLTQRINESMSRVLEAFVQNFEAYRRTLQAYDPNQALRRGYAIATQGGAVVKSIQGLKVGGQLVVELSDGKVDTEVKHVQKK